MKPLLLCIQPVDDRLQLGLAVTFSNLTFVILNIKIIIFLAALRSLGVEGKFSRKNITASANLGFLHTACDPESRARTSTRAWGILYYAQIIGEDHIAWIGMRNRGNKLQHTFLPRRKDLTGNDVTNQHLHIRRGMLASTWAVGIIKSHLLRKAIDIDNICRFDTKAISELLIKEALLYLLRFEFLPTANMDDL